VISALSHLSQGIKTEEKTKSGKLGIKKVKYTSNVDLPAGRQVGANHYLVEIA